MRSAFVSSGRIAPPVGLVVKNAGLCGGSGLLSATVSSGEQPSSLVSYSGVPSNIYIGSRGRVRTARKHHRRIEQADNRVRIKRFIITLESKALPSCLISPLYPIPKSP
jgi:hypothetical protein